MQRRVLSKARALAIFNPLLLRTMPPNRLKGGRQTCFVVIPGSEVWFYYDHEDFSGGVGPNRLQCLLLEGSSHFLAAFYTNPALLLFSTSPELQP